MHYFHLKPLDSIKNSKEVKKIFDIYKDDVFFTLEKNIYDKDGNTSKSCSNIKKLSYVNFIITKDNFLIFGLRSCTYYCSYIYSMLTSKHANINIKKILISIANLSKTEFCTLILYFIKNNYLEIIKHSLTPDNLKHLQDFHNVVHHVIFKSCNFDKIKDNPEFIDAINNMLSQYLIYNENLNFTTTWTPVLFGGKKLSEDESPAKTLMRENEEEICQQIHTINKKILNKDLKFVDFTEDNNISPILFIYTYDKILNRSYYDSVYIIYIDASLYELQQLFKPNQEIFEIYPIKISLNIDNMSFKDIKYLLQKYKQLFKNNCF